MEFHSGYEAIGDLYGNAGSGNSSPMDRSFHDSTSESAHQEGAENLGIGINDIGMSVPFGISAPNVQGVYSKIRAGISKMELGFPGAISGNRQAQTPEMYGKDQRQALRELAEINEVEYTTHAAYQMMGMTGAIEQANDMIKFDMNRARQAQHEVERAIDFAADVAGGGSVVIHTGEYMRPLTDMYLDPTNGTNLSEADDGRIMFKQRLTEDKDAKFYLVDDRTGQAMGTVEKDRLVALPKWNRYIEDNPDYWNGWKGKKGKSYVDDNGKTVKPGDYIDYQGNLIADPFDATTGRVPQYDTKSGRFEIKYMSYDDFRQEAEEKNYYKQKKFGRPLEFYETVTQTEAFLQATLETNEGHSRGWSLQYGERVNDHIQAIKGLNEAKRLYQQIDAEVPDEEKWKIMMRHSKFAGRYGIPDEIIPAESKHPLDFINDLISEQEKSLEFARQASASQEQQASDTNEQKTHIVEPIKYFNRFTARHYAETGIHAMEKTIKADDPLFVSIEHIFPERFGGHPQELKYVINQAREWMVKYLTEPEVELGTTYQGESVFERNEDQRLELKKQTNPHYRPGLSKQEAEQLAENHIKATIDTGHLNLWRKYFQPRPGASQEQNEKEFKNWYLTQVEDLFKEGLVGNIHLVDNYGYQDDHLSPGTGNAPLKEFLAIAKKYGYDDAITIEPGADASTDLSDFHGLMKTWRFLGSPIYGMSTPQAAQKNWNQVQYGYFGQNQPPYFIFGSYSPSNDWTLWSQTPME